MEFKNFLENSNSLVEGLVKPPHILVKEISEWVKAKVAVNKYIELKTEIDSKERHVKFLTTQINKSKEGPIYRASSKALVDINNIIPDLLAELAEYENIINSYTDKKIPLKEWSKSNRTFKLNMDGWKYKHLLKDKPYFDKAVKRYKNIIVELRYKQNKANYEALWVDVPAPKMTINGSTTESVYDYIEHELVHFVQGFISTSLDGFASDKGGVPSTNVATPIINQGLDYNNFKDNVQQRGIKYAMKKFNVKNITDIDPILDKYANDLKKQGIKQVDFHTLDDVEFYSILSDNLNEVKRLMKGLKADLGSKFNKPKVLGIILGAKKDPLIDSLKVWKRKDKNKYKKAVKVLTASIL